MQHRLNHEVPSLLLLGVQEFWGCSSGDPWDSDEGGLGEGGLGWGVLVGLSINPAITRAHPGGNTSLELAL